jgi:hypothetical protein
MTDYPGRRRNPPDDPTDEPTSDPVPAGEDVVNRHRRGRETPRRYEEAVEEPESELRIPAPDTHQNR